MWGNGLGWCHLLWLFSSSQLEFWLLSFPSWNSGSSPLSPAPVVLSWRGRDFWQGWETLHGSVPDWVLGGLSGTFHSPISIPGPGRALRSISISPSPPQIVARFSGIFPYPHSYPRSWQCSQKPFHVSISMPGPGRALEALSVSLLSLSQPFPRFTSSSLPFLPSLCWICRSGLGTWAVTPPLPTSSSPSLTTCTPTMGLRTPSSPPRPPPCPPPEPPREEGAPETPRNPLPNPIPQQGLLRGGGQCGFRGSLGCFGGGWGRAPNS